MTDRCTAHGVTRRRLLALGARGALAFPLVDLGAIATAEAAARWPSKQLNSEQARTVDPRQFLSAGQLRAWDVELDALGLRPTGSDQRRSAVTSRRS